MFIFYYIYAVLNKTGAGENTTLEALRIHKLSKRHFQHNLFNLHFISLSFQSFFRVFISVFVPLVFKIGELPMNRNGRVLIPP